MSSASTSNPAGCVVGAGPAGMVLSFLLARHGVAVTLLEAHHDFERDFRGDTIHPSTLEMLDQLGLADKLHQLPHRKLTRIAFATPRGRETAVDLSGLDSKFPYIMIMPQSAFLRFLAEEAAKYPSFRLVLGANVHQLIEEGGRVVGVRYQGTDAREHEVRARLTVGADGRFSRVRKLAGIELTKSAPPMDVVWFRLPKKPEDEPLDLAGLFHLQGGHFVVLFDRPGDEWQLGYVILKGGFQQLKTEGIESLRRSVAELVPPLADRVQALESFQQTTVLSVEVARVSTWQKPGLLLIGDAAHVMSPVGGIGIQYAVQDAVATANLLAQPLKRGTLTDEEVGQVQRRRETAIRRAQKLQAFLQDRIVKQALDPTRAFRLPCVVRVLRRLPFLRKLPGRIIGRGFGTERLAI
ncbi:MAG: FAD-dependent oxidoreductase [Gemmataceae bacterium]